MKYAFISEYAHEHSIALMCKVLDVSRSGYYRSRYRIVSTRESANVRLLEEIKSVHAKSRGIYGSPRVHRELIHRGHLCGRHRVARLMAREGIVGKVRRRYRTTTRQSRISASASWPRQPSTTRTALIAASSFPVWPTMSGFA